MPRKECQVSGPAVSKVAQSRVYTKNVRDFSPFGVQVPDPLPA